MVQLTNDELKEFIYHMVDKYKLEEMEKEVYIKYYENCIDNNVFDNINIPLSHLIYNDIMEDTNIIFEFEDDYKELKKLHRKGIKDISNYKFKSGNTYEYIECKHHQLFLVRY